MAKVSVQIVTWNSKRYINDCLESVINQTFKDFSVMVVDNGSNDDTVKFIRSNYPTVSILQNFKNLGYSKANNQGIHLSRSEFILVMNPDVILTQNYLENIIKFADQHSKAGSLTGKTLKLTSRAIDDDQPELREVVMSDVVDSVGLEIHKNLQAYNIGEGQKDEGQYSQSKEIFGASGACVVYRKEALVDIVIKNEFFDQDFFAYKEDVDLSWRLRQYGWSCWYEPSAISYHFRSLLSEGKEIKKIIKHRKEVSKKLRSLSFRNYHLMILKNEQWSNALAFFPWLLWWEIKMLGYAFFFEPWQYKTIGEIIKLIPSMIIKRKVIKAHRVVEAKELRSWFK